MSEQILSGSAVSQGTRYTGGISGDFAARHVLSDVLMIEPNLFPLYQSIMMQNKPALGIKNRYGLLEWVENEYVWNRDKVNEVTSVSGGNIVFKPANINLYSTDRMLYLEDIQQAGYVSAVDTGAGTVTVTRVTGNFSVLTAGGYVKLLGYAAGENHAAPPPAIVVDGMLQKQYNQIHEISLEMTDRMIAAYKAGAYYGDGDWETELKKKYVEIRRNIENSWWLQENEDAKPDAGTKTVKTYSRGVRYDIITNGTDFKYTGGKLSEAQMDIMLRDRKRGHNIVNMYCGVDIRYDVEQALKNRLMLTGPVKRYAVTSTAPGVDVVTYSSMGHEIRVITMYEWEGHLRKEACLLEMNDVRKGVFPADDKGPRDMRLENNIEDPKATKKQAKILADCSPILQNKAYHVWIRPQPAAIF
jgi:hypothetical protein